MKDKKIFIIIGAITIVFLFSKFMGGSNLVSIFLSISLLILFFLGRVKGRGKIGAIILGLIFLSVDFFLILLLIIPSKTYSISTKQYYQKKTNYMKVYIKDNKKDLNGMVIMIKRNKKWKPFKLLDYKIGQKIFLKQADKIYFMGSKKSKTYAVIYLWDDTILRITPGTKLNLTKIKKNLKDLSSSKTEINLESGNIWFRVLKLVKDSSNMKINTGSGQTLIIRGTAGLVSRDKDLDITKAIDYSHFIEVKNSKQSKMLNPNQGVILKKDKIYITDKIIKVLNSIGITEEQVEKFKELDKKDIKQFKENLISYIKEQSGTLRGYELFRKLENIKYKIFSIGDKNYKEKLDSLINYDYLIGKTDNFTDSLLQDPNMVFIASNLEKQKVKVGYLYEQYKNNIKNSDIYKTYIINLGIENKASDINGFINDSLKNIEGEYDNLMKDLDF